MARRFAHGQVLVLSLLALVLTACGGGQNAADGTETRTALPDPTTSASAPDRSGSPSPTAVATRTPTAPLSPSAPPSPSASAPPQATASPATAWTADPKSGPAAGSAQEPPVLEAVRVGRHPAFHRVVLEFSDGTPEFTAAYTRTLRQGGSGRTVAVEGDHVLLLVLRGMTPESHFDDAPTTSVVRDVVTASIFEGDMRIGIGLDTGGPDRPGFRVDTFGDKLVLDFSHTG